MLRAIAIPVSVFIAGAGCLATLAALGAPPLSTVRVSVSGEPGPADRNADPPAAGTRDSEGPRDGGTGPESFEPRGPTAPQLPESAQDSAGPRMEKVPLDSFNGARVRYRSFEVAVEVCYADATVTDGMGSHAAAPGGMEYVIYRLNVTNTGESAAVFDPVGSYGVGTDGTVYPNDPDAEVTVAWDYFWGPIAPGETVTTHILFLVPTGTEMAEVMVDGSSRLTPN